MGASEIGGLIEAVGLIVTGWGISQTWRHNASEPFVAPVTETARRGASWARRTYRRARGRRDVVIGAAAIEVTAAIGAMKVRVDWPPLDLSLETPAALAELDARIRALSDRQIGNVHRIDDRATQIETAFDACRTEAGRQAEELAAMPARLVVEGLRVEAVGLALVGIGLLIPLIF